MLSFAKDGPNTFPRTDYGKLNFNTRVSVYDFINHVFSGVTTPKNCFPKELNLGRGGFQNEGSAGDRPKPVFGTCDGKLTNISTKNHCVFLIIIEQQM